MESVAVYVVRLRVKRPVIAERENGVDTPIGSGVNFPVR